ncbi:MAG: DUF4062 domain-containing protein [Methylococcales bacterium]|nr:DUF4062 domain-containing protein [Methylococcales bacterium]
MKTPTFFISSTIYDFKDLRSALKFYLEEQGCKVMASEFNDFATSSDAHSYDACLEAIKSADYFILLIGSRVGGWYDKENRISITQREYREAYELQKAGKIKIFNFVRSEIWNLKDNQKELEKYLESISLDKSVKEGIINRPSKNIEDAKLICEFIDEVGRVQDTKLAISGNLTAPIANWIHIFDGFKDIIDALNTQIPIFVPVEEMTMRRLLRRELREFLRMCLPKMQTGIFSPLRIIQNFHKQHKITAPIKANESVFIDRKSWNAIQILAIHLLRVKLKPLIIERVLESQVFLKFDRTIGYKETPVYDAIALLQKEIQKMNVANTTETMGVVFLPAKSDEINVDKTKLLPLLHVLDRWSNILALSKSILRYLDTNEFIQPSLRPDSFIDGMQEELDQEIPTDEEIDQFVLGG